MNLNDLLRKLYLRKDKLKKRSLSDDSYDPTKQDQAKGEFDKFEGGVLDRQTGEDVTEEQVHVRNKKFFLLGAIVIGILVGMLGIVIAYFKFIGSAFTEEKVVISISGPDEVRSVEESEFKITIENANRIGLQNAKLQLSYPSNMVIVEQEYIQKKGFERSEIEIGSISSKGKMEFEVSFKPFGPRDKQVYLDASLSYKPKNFNSVFNKSVQKSIMIKSSPITITTLPVKKAASGEEVSIDFIIKNESNKEYKDLELRVEYPEGFIFGSSRPDSTRDKNIWSISNLPAKEQLKISVLGTLEGNVDALKRFSSVIGEARGDDRFLVYTEDEGIIKIVQSRVQITVEQLKDVAYPGETVGYVVNFKNTSDVALRDLILYQYVDSRLLVEEETFPIDGYYDSARKVMYWKASDIPALKNLQPGQQGSVSSSVQFMDVVPMNNERDRNYKAISYAEIESLDVDSPLWKNKRVRSVQKEIKVHSKMILNVSATHNDGEIPNSGPIPLKVGQETTFTIRFSVMNTSNDMKNVILKTSMPSGIVWKDNYLPKNAGFEINTRSNHVNLVIGTVEAGVGFIEPVKTFAFQVAVIPSINQIGEARKIELLHPITLTAIDSFTEKEVEYSFANITLNSVDDIIPEVIR